MEVRFRVECVVVERVIVEVCECVVEKVVFEVRDCMERLVFDK